MEKNDSDSKQIGKDTRTDETLEVDKFEEDSSASSVKPVESTPDAIPTESAPSSSNDISLSKKGMQLLICYSEFTIIFQFILHSFLNNIINIYIFLYRTFPQYMYYEKYYILYYSKQYTVFNADELRQALMPTLEKLYKQEQESVPFQYPVDAQMLQIPVSCSSIDLHILIL